MGRFNPFDDSGMRENNGMPDFTKRKLPPGRERAEAFEKEYGNVQADVVGGGGGGMVPTGVGEDSNEIPSPQSMPRPVILWGVVAATVATLKDVFESYKHMIDLDYIKITPAFPTGEQTYPQLQVGVSNFSVQHYGFQSQHIDQDWKDYDHPENPGKIKLALKSQGRLNLKFFVGNPRRAFVFQDFFTQVFLLNKLYGDSYYFEGTHRDYVAINYQPGKLQWSDIRDEKNIVDSNESIYTMTASFDFIAEHTATFEAARVSAISLTAYLDGVPIEAEVTTSSEDT